MLSVILEAHKICEYHPDGKMIQEDCLTDMRPKKNIND